jgi:hypothetical protein
MRATEFAYAASGNGLLPGACAALLDVCFVMCLAPMPPRGPAGPPVALCVGGCFAHPHVLPALPCVRACPCAEVSNAIVLLLVCAVIVWMFQVVVRVQHVHYLRSSLVDQEVTCCAAAPALCLPRPLPQRFTRAFTCSAVVAAMLAQCAARGTWCRVHLSHSHSRIDVCRAVSVPLLSLSLSLSCCRSRLRRSHSTLG